MTWKGPRYRRQRLNRSQLVVPGNRASMVAKALRSDADIVLIDLEDSVAPMEKPRARSTIIEILNAVERPEIVVSVRINAADTPYMYRDLVDIVEQAGDRLDLLMVPKVSCSVEVAALDMLVTQIEQARGWSHRIGLELLIETATGIENAMVIATASPRSESLHFGPLDYAASIGVGMRASTADADHPEPDDSMNYPMARIVTVARANGLRAVDGPYADYTDGVGFERAARRARRLGFDGKWAIHPDQIPLANGIMGPAEEDVQMARRIMAALSGVDKPAVAALDGRMIDGASLRHARDVIAQADQIKERNRGR